MNLAAVLSEVYSNQRLSRSDLVKRLGLSKTSIQDIAEELEKHHLVRRELGSSNGAVGRPSELVIASDYLKVLVLNPETDGLAIGIVSFGSSLSHQKFVPFERQYGFEEVRELVTGYIGELPEIVRSQLRAVSLALPGAIDQTIPRLLDAPSLGWKALEPAELIEAELQLPVVLVNNARAALLGESHMGCARNLKNVVYLFSGVGGIGGGFIVEGKILNGSRSLAGEIGKMRTFSRSNSQRLTFGETLLRERVSEKLGGRNCTDEALDTALNETHSAQLELVLDSQADALVDALATLRDLFDPDRIILGGFLGSLLRVRYDEIIRQLNLDPLGRKAAELLVSRPTQVKEMVLHGAAVTAWKRILDNPLILQGGNTNA